MAHDPSVEISSRMLRCSYEKGKGIRRKVSPDVRGEEEDLLSTVRMVTE